MSMVSSTGKLVSFLTMRGAPLERICYGENCWINVTFPPRPSVRIRCAVPAVPSGAIPLSVFPGTVTSSCLALSMGREECSCYASGKKMSLEIGRAVAV